MLGAPKHRLELIENQGYGLCIVTAQRVLFTCALFGCWSCDSFYRVHGRVSSCVDRRPLPGVIVHLITESREGFAKTKADGSYDVALNEPEGDNPSKLTVAKFGYVTEEHAIANPHAEQNVCLRSEAK